MCAEPHVDIDGGQRRLAHPGGGRVVHPDDPDVTWDLPTGEDGSGHDRQADVVVVSGDAETLKRKRFSRRGGAPSFQTKSDRR